MVGCMLISPIKSNHLIPGAGLPACQSVETNENRGMRANPGPCLLERGLPASCPRQGSCELLFCKNN